LLRETLQRNRGVFLPALAGVVRGIYSRRSEFRHHVVRDAWTVAKRFGADTVQNIELREIPVVGNTVVEGPIDDSHRLLLAALARGLDSRTFFEIGTNRGYTTWTVAHNNPDLVAYTLDVPSGATPSEVAMELPPDDRRFFAPGPVCGEAFRDTPEAERITQLLGDSAAFDFSPWHGSIDLIYIDGAHTYEYVMSDTEHAMRMLAPGGTIAWDDYTINPGVWRAVREIASQLGEPVYHVFGTRLALYSRQPLVHRIPFDRYTAMPTI
jgi:predicted O-methyltransferase YrrM